MSEFVARVAAIALSILLFVPPFMAPGQAFAADSPPTFSHEQLDQLTAPIALYPDSLQSQVLMGMRPSGRRRIPTRKATPR
jgi:hypothetical protein